MGNIIKINMYAERRKEVSKEIDLKRIEENILHYNEWLKNNHKEDKIESYENFLRAK
jgi:hypothetical protein